MPTRKAANALSGGAKGYHVSRLQREIAAGLSNTGLDRKTVIASMIPGENLVIDRPDDMQVVRISNCITQCNPRATRAETVGAL